MTRPTAVTLLAFSALLAAAGPGRADDAVRGPVLAQAETPLVLPAPPGETAGTPLATPPAGQPAPDAGASPSAAPSPVPSAGEATPPAGTAPAAPPAETGADQAPPSPDAGAQDGGAEDTPGGQLSLGEIPSIETMDLTLDIAKRALDSYLSAKAKYADTDLDQYENLQDFVDQTEDGKKFEADVKAAGFANVTDWNLAITTLGLTYSSVTDDQTADLQQQIKEVEADTELAQDIKDRMIKALNALIPSANNKKVIQDMMADPVYGEKLKQLDIEEE